MQRIQPHACLPATTELHCRHDLEFRRKCLEAESVQHLCKSIVMENTKLSEPVAGVSKYYCVIVQVTPSLSTCSCTAIQCVHNA